MNPIIDLMCSISSNGDTVALCSPDGVIKFYDTLTSNLKYEYSSSTHLQASCTCLSFSKCRKKNLSSSKQKKVKTDQLIENELNDLDLIAIGTSQGAVLIYSLSKAALHTQLSEEGHVDKVNDICWCPLFRDSLYTCSDDGHLIEWSLIESKTKNKWKASKTPITALNVDSTSKFLISSSKTLTIWDLETKTKLKTLTGHSNDVLRILFLNNSLSKSVGNESTNKFFVTAALNDRILNAWSLDSTSSASNSFSISDGPIFLDVVSIPNSSSDKNENSDHSISALIVAVTSKGHLFVYNHQIGETELDGKLKKPVKAVNQLQIETNEGLPLKIYGAFVTNSASERFDSYESLSDLNIFIIYGSSVNPKIEKLQFSDLNEKKIVFKREDPFKTSVTLQTQTIKIETPLISKDLKVLQPGFMAPQTNSITSGSKRKSTEPSQMSLEERLNVMGIDSNSSMNGDAEDSNFKEPQIPKTDNLLVLLVQGLQSNDSKMLNHVLQHKNEKVVAKTVRLLPTNHIIPLVKELNKRLQGHAQSGMGIVKWLKCVLMAHTSYLMSYPDLIDSLGSVYEMMNARTKLFPQLSKLQGKLQLVMSQVSSQAEGLQSNEKDGEPLLFYQDSDSEDEQFEELIPSHSEFDDYLFSDEEEEDDENMENDDDEIKDSQK